MTRLTVLAATLMFAVSTQAFADISNYAPDKRLIGRTGLKDICIAMGDVGKGFNLDGTTGNYGCQNRTTGDSVSCSEDGQCTDHVGDPRWLRIKTLIDNAGKKKQGLIPL